MEKPVKKKKKGISPIWILPVVALAIGMWLLYKGITERPVEVIVHFHSAEGLTAGKTKVMYKGIPVGRVKDIRVDKGFDSVSAILAMSPETKDSLVEDVKFWIVRPEITAGRISGLETLLSGSYIAVQPGVSKVKCLEFQGLDEPPPVPDSAPGLHIRLKTDALNSIQKGSYIYYRDIQVGSVQDYKMNGNKGIVINAYIEPEYRNLVKPGSRFWNASGITLSGGLSGIKFHMESLSTLISGGISFYTPESLMDQPPAENGHTFKLYDDYEAAEYGIKVWLKMETGEDMVEGLTKVIYRGIEVGRIKKIILNRNDRKYKVTAELLMDPMAQPILRTETRFWVIRPKVGTSGIKNIGALVSGAYITFVPGKGEPCYEFVVQGSHSKEILKTGKFYRLEAADLSSLEPGAPIRFKHIQVGEVASYKLNNDNSVDLVFIIYDKYVRLMNQKCVFWNYSGLNLKVTPAEVNLKTDAIGAILAGGIAFDYPHHLYGKKLKPAKPGHRFKLYKNFQDALKHSPGLKPPGITVKLETADPVSISEGSPVYYKDVKVGEVTGISLNTKRDKIRVTAYVEKKYQEFVRSSSRFYLSSGVKIRGSIRTGLDVQAPPLAAIMMGSVAFMNPEKRSPGNKVKRGQIFRLYKDMEDALAEDYLQVNIHFPPGIKVDVNAKIRNQGVEIGYVKDVVFENGMQSILVKGLVRKSAASLFTTGSKVWVVRPQFSLAGIRNLETAVTGPYITVQAGPGSTCTDIMGLAAPPAVSLVKSGLNIITEANSLGSLKKGCPVYYRRVRVGRITGYELAPDARKVWVHVNIEEPYTPLVRSNTKFWNASGIRVDAGLFSGIDVKTETIEAILAGGIAFATPEGEDMGTRVYPGHHFVLHEKADDDWLEWNPAISLKK